jgi:hypothetical protein
MAERSHASPRARPSLSVGSPSCERMRLEAVCSPGPLNAAAGDTGCRCHWHKCEVRDVRYLVTMRGKADVAVFYIRRSYEAARY